MADISKCVGNNCFIKKQCYRFTAKENQFSQSYFLRQDTNPVKTPQECKAYIANEE